MTKNTLIQVFFIKNQLTDIVVDTTYKIRDSYYKNVSKLNNIMKIIVDKKIHYFYGKIYV